MLSAVRCRSTLLLLSYNQQSTPHRTAGSREDALLLLLQQLPLLQAKVND
jgi:hypothetical protein